MSETKNQNPMKIAKNERADEYTDANFPNIRVLIVKPEEYGDRYVLEQGLRLLNNAYEKFYGKRFKL